MSESHASSNTVDAAHAEVQKFIESVHERVFAPRISQHNGAQLEAARDAMLLRAKLAATTKDLDEVLKSYTVPVADQSACS